MFRLPLTILKDLEKYKASLEDLQDGKISSSRFKGVRVPWGIYSHRGGKVFMARIRIPAGIVTSSQLKALAEAARKYGDGNLHITTRQDIQIHNVNIENTVKVMESLKGYNLSPRGGGGNTVRNILACPLAGLCKEEVFDVRGDAIALTEYLLRQESSYTMPRKFKISFSGCSQDCVGCLVNDVGLVARHKNGKEGYTVFVGGGLGANSRVGKLLEEFISREEMVYCVQAVKNVFYKKADRRNKHHNRLRFLIEDIGFEKFRKFYEEELRDIKEQEFLRLRKIDFADKDTGSEGEIFQKVEEPYQAFLMYSVRSQKQRGFSDIEVRIPRGDISSQKLLKLAELENDFPGIEFRTSQNQNLIITWVKNRDVHKLYLSLRNIMDDFLYPGTLLDVVACKGAVTCNLGLCNSPALAKEIEQLVKEEFIGKKVFSALNIKINGCPNACGHHPVGKLAFHGLVRRVDNRPVPFYKFFLGGRKEFRCTRLAEEMGILPVRNISKFLEAFLNKLEGELEKESDVYKFLCDGAKEVAKEVLRDFQYVPPYSENKEFYIDLGRSEEFSLAGLGPGECGAGVLDMIESDLTEAKIALEEAEKGRDGDLIRKVLFYSARALLVVKGVDAKSESDAFRYFREKFIDENIASEAYSDIERVFKSTTEGLDSEEKRERLTYAKEFFLHINQLYKNMDPLFSFPKLHAVPPEQKKHKVRTLDLKGTPCPINYVKAKLFLGELDSGDIVEILLDEGEPVQNVPRSLKDDGHEIIAIEKIEQFYRVKVKKK